ncbi:hypothetical protein, partial [Pseudomonas aeruginosa]
VMRRMAFMGSMKHLVSRSTSISLLMSVRRSSHLCARKSLSVQRSRRNNSLFARRPRFSNRITPCRLSSR